MIEIERSSEWGRRVAPESFLMSDDCRMHWIYTEGNVLLDAHELEAIRTGAQFREIGTISGDDMIESKTSRGHLLTYVDAGEVKHAWAYDN